MGDSLTRILEATASGVTAAAWESALPRIQAERGAVERLIETDPPPKVYGFTTLLGPLEHVADDAVGQDRVLEAHRLGVPRTVPDRVARLIAAFKAEQLSHGGSGVSAATYQRVLACAVDTPPCSIAWETSYGSGDVVPAAWWVTATSGSELKLPRGDLIALLNGHFVSSSVATAGLLTLVSYASRFLSVAGSVAAAVPANDDVLGSLLTLIAGDPPGAQGQRAVSVRDTRLFARPIVTSLRSLIDALEYRSAAASGNPLFEFADGVARPVSQASFLDAGLTFQLVAAQQLVLFCMGATQRFTDIVCQDLAAGSADPDPALVQPPKVSQALLENARAVAPAPASYSGAQSGGVEDLWDGSLIAAMSLIRVLARAEEQVELIEGLLDRGGAKRRPALEVSTRLMDLAGLPSGAASLVAELTADDLGAAFQGAHT